MISHFCNTVNLFYVVMATCTVSDVVVLATGSLHIGLFTTKSLNVSYKKSCKNLLFKVSLYLV